MFAKQALIAAAGLTAALALHPADAQTPKRGGILVMPLEGEPPNLDCHQSQSLFVVQTIRPIYSNLVRYDQARFPAIVGDVAESWTTSPDGLTYTFKLRPNVKFHDGGAMTSEDIRASFERVRNPPQGVASIRKVDMGDITAIDAPDPMTVVFKLAQPNAAFLDLLANPFQCIYSARRLAANPLYPMTEPMGTGPFQFVEYQRGAVLSGKRFDGYFRDGLPYLDGYRQQVIQFGAPAVNAVIAGQVDVILRGLNPPELQSVKDGVGDKMYYQPSPMILNNFLLVNSKRKPLDDVRVRRALMLAIDRKGGLPNIQKIVNAAGYGGILRPGAEYALPAAESDKLLGADMSIDQARAEARRLLAEAGQSNAKLTLLNRNLPIYTPLGIFVIDQWRQIGLDVQHELLDTTTVVSRITSAEGNFDMTIDTNGQPTDDPTVMLVKYLPGSPANYGSITDQPLSDLFNRQKITVDKMARKQLVNDFERRVLQQADMVPLFWASTVWALRNNVKNWPITPVFQLGYELTEVWKE